MSPPSRLFVGGRKCPKNCRRKSRKVGRKSRKVGRKAGRKSRKM